MLLLQLSTLKLTSISSPWTAKLYFLLFKCICFWLVQNLSVCKSQFLPSIKSNDGKYSIVLITYIHCYDIIHISNNNVFLIFYFYKYLLNLLCVAIKYSLFISIPKKRLFNSSAATPQDPTPINGSKTISFGLLETLMIFFKISTGFWVGWNGDLSLSG